MIKLSNRNKLFLGLGLMLLMLITRGNHFASLQSLPSASLAIFFLAGVYIRRVGFFAVLLFEAALIDYVVITFGGVSSFCVSPAYSLLILAYGIMWAAGYWYGAIHKNSWVSLLTLSVILVSSVFLSELISSGGFYYFSDRFTETNLTEFAARLIKYSPSALANTAFYIGCCTLIHSIVEALKSTTEQDASVS